jgi:hypothetical protein
MAQRVICDLVDDLDGGIAQETVTFGLDGKEFEIDLSEENAKLLRDRLDRYLSVARRTGGRRRVSSPAGPRSSSDHQRSQGIRSWAATAEGRAILAFKAISPPSARGRFARELQEAYSDRARLAEEMKAHEALRAAYAAQEEAARVNTPEPAPQAPESAPVAAQSKKPAARKRAPRKMVP